MGRYISGMVNTPNYLFEGFPAPGETWEIASGIWWVRMPLPFKLDHVNLWFFADGEGWTVVDTGVYNEETKLLWAQIEKNHVCPRRPIKRLICTHYHPDHMGLAGWFCDRHGISLTTTFDEWVTARVYCLETQKSKSAQMLPFFKKAGFSENQMKLVIPRSTQYKSVADMPPHTFKAINAGDVLHINGDCWKVITAEGHSVKQACLYCSERNILISADQVLPRITPNVSLQVQEPEGNPLKGFLDSLDQFRVFPADTLVLPSHGSPFYGLLERVDNMAKHHKKRLDLVLRACSQQASGVDILKKMFTRELDNHQVFFALGEALAHVQLLIYEGKIKRTIDANGIYLYKAS